MRISFQTITKGKFADIIPESLKPLQLEAEQIGSIASGAIGTKEAQVHQQAEQQLEAEDKNPARWWRMKCADCGKPAINNQVMICKDCINKTMQKTQQKEMMKNENS